MLYGLDVLRFRISIHTLKLDVPEKYSSWRKYQTMTFEKVSDNGFFLYDLDTFRSQVYQTMAFEKVSDNGFFIWFIYVYIPDIYSYTYIGYAKTVLPLEKISANGL